jgi:threonine/homoserine efflux transporter RhtA
MHRHPKLHRRSARVADLKRSAEKSSALYFPVKKPSKTKLALAVAIGSAIGTLIFPLLRGVQVDWLRAVFVGTFSLLVFLAIPKRWIERVPSEKKKESSFRFEVRR